MKNFLLTLEYPYTGHEKIHFRRIKARTMNSAMNKGHKLVKQIYAGGGYGGVKLLHCEEIISSLEFWTRKAIVEAELKATQEKLAALTVEAHALARLAEGIHED